VEKCPTEDGKKICLYENNDKASELEDYCFTTYSTVAYGMFCMPNIRN